MDKEKLERFINYQGLKLVSSYNKSILDVEINPKTVLLEPTYPHFGYDWAQKVKLKVFVKDAPKGEQNIDIDILAPTPEFSDKWVSKYLERYVDAGAFGIGRPFYTLVLRIQ